MLDEALAKNSEARSVADARQEAWQLPGLLAEEAEVHQARGNHSLAKQLALEAKEAAEVSGDDNEVKLIHALLGRIEYSRGDVDASERMLARAVGLHETLRPDHPDLVELQ